MTTDQILQLESRLDAWTREGAEMARELAALKAKASAPPAQPEPLPSLGEVGWKAWLIAAGASEEEADRNVAHRPEEAIKADEACAAAVIAEHARRTKREPTIAEAMHLACLFRDTEGDSCSRMMAVLRRERGLDA